LNQQLKVKDLNKLKVLDLNKLKVLDLKKPLKVLDQSKLKPDKKVLTPVLVVKKVN